MAFCGELTTLGMFSGQLLTEVQHLLLLLLLRLYELRTSFIDLALHQGQQFVRRIVAGLLLALVRKRRCRLGARKVAVSADDLFGAWGRRLFPKQIQSNELLHT